MSPTRTPKPPEKPKEEEKPGPIRRVIERIRERLHPDTEWTTAGPEG